jgi:hypothetical protein
MTKKHIVLATWMLVVAGLSIEYISTNIGKHPELNGLVLILFFAFEGIMVGISFIIKKLDNEKGRRNNGT